MATFKALVRKQDERTDGSFRVLVRVTLFRKSDYIKTKHYINRNHLNKDNEIISKDIKKLTDLMIERYQEELIRIDDSLDNYTAKSLVKHLENFDKKKNIDFIEFGRNYIQELINTDRKRTSVSFNTALNALQDYIEDVKLPITRLNSELLFGFESFLKTERTVKRIGRGGEEVITTNAPLSPSGIRNYMRDLRNLFKKACDLYNDEDTGVMLVKHYPFKKYKVKDAPRKKTKRNIDVKAIRTIRDIKVERGRAKLAQDVYMMMFYLMGMNSVDLYKATTSIKNGRLNYNRSKTKGRRLDKAFISVKIEPEIESLIEKYLDPTGERLFIFHKLYATNEGFNSAINKGLKQLVQLVDDKDLKEELEDVDAYSSRHSWSSLARNKCGIDKDDIDEALNHLGEHALTDLYLERDWSIIDNANRKVLDYIKKV